MASGAALAYQDLRTGSFSPLVLAPSVLGAAWFYSTLGPLFLLTPALLALFSVPAVYVTLWSFDWWHMKHLKDGLASAVGTKGDYLVMGVLCLWPAGFAFCAESGMLIGLAGHRAGVWNRGRRGVPLAGLMAGVCLPLGALLLLAPSLPLGGLTRIETVFCLVAAIPLLLARTPRGSPPS